MKKALIFSILLLSLIIQPISAFAAISASYSAPPVNPPANTHPRVLFTNDDISRLQQVLNGTDEQNSYAREAYNYRLGLTASDTNGGGNANGGHNQKKLINIEAKAFDYAVNGTVSNGELAVDYILEYLSTMNITGNETTISRNGGHVMYVASEVYDWCYDLLSSTEKNTIISALENLAKDMEIGWPPTSQGAVTGHGSEAQLLRDMLTFAIAVYDERPDIWNVVGGRFYQQYVPARNYYHRAHYNLQGDSYGLYRHRWDSWAYFLITGMGAPAPYESTENLYNVAYSQIYMRRPDGQYFRDGDTSYDADHQSPFAWWSHFAQIYMMNAAIGNDPYLKHEWIRNDSSMSALYEDSAVLQLIVNDPSLEPKSITNLPHSRFFDAPAGIMAARTSWDEGVDSSAVVAQMKIGGDVVNNHQHLDAGHFQLYYKGILASDSGIYQGGDDNSDYDENHHKFYSTKTVAHNTMLVYNPSEVTTTWFAGRGTCLDGGQKGINSANEYKTLPSSGSNTVATVVSKEIDRNNPNKPKYTYIKGDLTKAYSSKVSDFKRSFMFLDLKRDDVPAALIVLDNVTSSSASYKKTWLLHGQEEPIINGTQTVFARTYANENGAYNGKMTVDTLLPTSPTISKIGGNGNWSYVGGKANKNYEAAEADTPVDEGNTWRIEISPSASAKTDTFLNVLQVSDNDKNYYLTPNKIDDGTIVGVEIADRVVTFSKSGSELSNAITLSAPGGETEYTLCDVKAGTWTVSDGTISNTYQATEDGNVLSFIDSSAKGTTLTVTYTSSTVTETVPNPQPTNIDYYNLYNDTEQYYTEHMARLDENKKPLVAAEDIADILGLTMTENGNIIRFEKGVKKCSFEIGENKIQKGSLWISRPDEAAPVLIDGEVYISPVTIADYYGAEYSINRNTLEIVIVPGGDEASYGLSYSLDGGETFIGIPNFDYDTTGYTVTLPDNITSVEVKFDPLIDGTVCYANKNTVADGTGLAGLATASNIPNFTLQYNLPRYLSDGANMTSANVPIKNGKGTSLIYFTDEEENETSYEITFNSYNQPHLTSFTNYNTDGAVAYISGAAAWNDNGSIVATNHSENRIWALGNISEYLHGTSMFVTPFSSGTSSWRATKLNDVMFSFTADSDGEIIVMSPNSITGSDYTSNWTLVNNGTDASGITVSTSPTANSNYSNTDYFATAYKWIGGNADDVRNLWRTQNPGIVSAPTGTYQKQGIKLKYAYKKSFKAGDTVNVYNPVAASDEAGSILGIFVKWANKKETVIYSDNFESGVITSNTNYATEGGWRLAEKAGIDASGCESSYAFCPGWKPGLDTARGAWESSFYYIPENQRKTSGEYVFKFDYYLGEGMSTNNLYLCANVDDYVSLNELRYGAGLALKTWYSMEASVDLDSDTFEFVIFNTDGTVLYRQTGEYEFDTVQFIEFGLTSQNNWAGNIHTSVRASKLDNLIVSHYSEEEASQQDVTVYANSSGNVSVTAKGFADDGLSTVASVYDSTENRLLSIDVKPYINGENQELDIDKSVIGSDSDNRFGIFVMNLNTMEPGYGRKHNVKDVIR